MRAAALPLVTLTGEQLVRLGTKIAKGQTVLVAGAVGSVGRAAVATAKEAGATVIAGVRKKQLEQAEELKAHEVLALDDEETLAKLGFLDAVADTVGGEIAQKLIGKIKPGGVFASVLGPPQNAKMHPAVELVAVMAKPDLESLYKLGESVAAGKFSIPIDRMIPLADAGKGQAAAEKGGVGKILLVP